MAGRPNHKVYLTLLFILIVAALTAKQTQAEYGGGSGTAGDPYLIYTAAQMNAIGANPLDWDKHFKLMADIDLGEFTGELFNIIGNSTSSFRGVFDGDGHVISNFHYETSEIHDYVGLFGYVCGEIHNLGLIDPVVVAENCEAVGSLAGRLSGEAITNCFAENCYVSGDRLVGGLVGWTWQSPTMTNCYATGIVKGENAGGLIGGNNGYISYCFADVQVEGNGWVGGFSGTTGSSGALRDCYSHGSVSGIFQDVGGFCGLETSYKESISRCYSTGNVSVSPGCVNVGGFLGRKSTGDIYNCFWDIETSGQTSSAGGTGKSTAQMQTQSTFTSAGWDFTTPVWTIAEEDYPRLWWETTLYVPGHFPTIQAAIDAAADGDTVIVAPGTYTGTGNRDIDFNGKAITVRSSNPNNPDIVAATIIDCNGTEAEPHRGFFFQNGEDTNSVLEGFTITNSYSDYGGAILCNSASPTVNNCTFANNYAKYGGGIYNYNYSSPEVTNCTFTGNSAGQYGGGMLNDQYSSPTITNCTFTGNSAHDGGGIFNYENNPTITNCTFSGNSAETGGGMFNYYSSSTITNCTFSGNSGYSGSGMSNMGNSPTITNCSFSKNSGFEGGGMSNYSSNPIVTNCTFSGNVAYYGGGMYNDSSNPIVTNCIFSGNSAGYYGGGIYNWDCSLTVTNCIFSGNAAGEYGGGMHNLHYSKSTVTNCILWGNSAPVGPEIYNSMSTLTVTYSDVQDGWPGTGNIDADPCFVDADGADNIIGTEDDNPSLLAGSACADAGNNDAVPEGIIADLHGDPRFADDPYAPDTGYGTAPIVDMGAYEGAKPSFVLSAESITVPEGQTEIFTVALVLEPAGTVQVTSAYESGDSDITVQSGAVLTFDPYNYSIPQTVVLAAAEDEDHLHSSTKIRISALGFINCAVTATELDNEPNQHILFVDVSAAGGNNGANWPNALNDLQEALHLAAEYPQFEQVLVAQGVYTPARTEGDREATFQLVSGVAIYGGFPTGGGMWQDRDPDAHKTILSGDLNGDDGPNFSNNGENSYQVVTSEGAIETTVLDGFTITGGSNSGMRNIRSSLTITNCTFSGNYGFFGAGMHNYNYGSPTIINCTFSGNAAERWGGGMCNEQSNPILIGCRFIANSGDEGGGMRNSYNSPTITNCTFSDNSAEYGGGMYNNNDSSPIVSNCTFSGNSASYGGGMCNYNTYSSPSNPSSPTVLSCTFLGNSAPNGSACACDSYEQKYPSNVEMNNCILWDGGQEIWNNDGSIITISYTDLQGGQSACYDPCDAIEWDLGNIDADPCFIDANNPDPNLRDYHLLASSPCINAGDPNYTPEPNETDIDGEPRVMLGRVDMGADEFNPFEIVFNIVNKRRVGRTLFEYDCNVTLTNISLFTVTNVQFEIVDASENMVLIDPNVTFGALEIGPGESATSIDMCTFQIDRSEPAEIMWQSDYEIVDGVLGVQDIASGACFLNLVVIGGDINGDDKVDLDDLDILVDQWLQPPGTPSADIVPPPDGDNIVNFLDFALLAKYWLRGIGE